MTEQVPDEAARMDTAEVPQQKQEASEARQRADLPEELVRPSAEELEVARELVRSARDRGTALTGPEGPATAPSPGATGAPNSESHTNEPAPYRPRTNGEIERFHRTLADGWAYARLYESTGHRNAALPRWLHVYNHHRAHSAIGGKSRPPG